MLLLTAIEGIDATAERNLIGKNDTGIDGKETAGKPPAKRVANKVNLLARVVLCPEADTAEQEWPLVGMAGIGMAACELAVVVKHGALELEIL